MDTTKHGLEAKSGVRFFFYFLYSTIVKSVKNQITIMAYTEEDCMEALHKAKEKLGHSPSQKEYRDLEISPSEGTISRTMGGWNNAKKEAGLKTKNQKSLEEIPEHLNITEQEWREMPKSTRHYHRNREEVRERVRKNSKERRKKARNFIRETKDECVECGEDRHPDLLEYHHRDEKDKNMSVGNMASQGKSIEKIEKEINKCDLLCANCHRLEHT